MKTTINYEERESREREREESVQLNKYIFAAAIRASAERTTFGIRFDIGTHSKSFPFDGA